MARRKTAKEKLYIDRVPQVGEMPDYLVARYGRGKFLVPTPLQVDELIRSIPRGQTRKVSELRAELARRNGADVCCPLCFGIFWRLSAEAAEEDRAAGIAEIAPYWRVVRDDGKMNPKLPGQASLLAAERR